MIAFDLREVAFSILYALIYGVGFALFYSFMILLKTVWKHLSRVTCDLVKFYKITPLPTFDYILKRQSGGVFLIALSVLFFGLGFSLLSYVALDGQIRIYMLILCFASFYLSKLAFYEIFVKLLLHLLRVILRAFSMPMRIILFPINRLVKRIFILFQNK